MAFNPSGHALAVDTIGGGSLRLHFYRTDDDIEDVLADDYIPRASARGFRVDDYVLVAPEDDPVVCFVESIDESDNATLARITEPDVDEEPPGEEVPPEDTTEIDLSKIYDVYEVLRIPDSDPEVAPRPETYRSRRMRVKYEATAYQSGDEIWVYSPTRNLFTQAQQWLRMSDHQPLQGEDIPPHDIILSNESISATLGVGDVAIWIYPQSKHPTDVITVTKTADPSSKFTLFEDTDLGGRNRYCLKLAASVTGGQSYSVTLLATGADGGAGQAKTFSIRARSSYGLTNDEAEIFAGACEVELNSTYRTALDTLVSALKTAISPDALTDVFIGVWPARFPTRQAACLNLVQSKYHLWDRNSGLQYVPHEYFASDGIRGRLGSQFIPNVHGGGATPVQQTETHIGGEVVNSASAQAGAFMGNWHDLPAQGADTYTFLNPNSRAGSLLAFVNAPAGIYQSFIGVTPQGHFIAARDADNQKTWRNGTLVGTKARGSGSPLPQTEIEFMHGGGQNFGSREGRAFHLGGALTNDQAAAISTAFSTFNSAVAAEDAGDLTLTGDADGLNIDEELSEVTASGFDDPLVVDEPLVTLYGKEGLVGPAFDAGWWVWHVKLSNALGRRPKFRVPFIPEEGAKSYWAVPAPQDAPDAAGEETPDAITYPSADNAAALGYDGPAQRREWFSTDEWETATVFDTQPVVDKIAETVEFQHSKAFLGNTVWVSHRPAFSYARLQAKLLALTGNPRVVPTTSSIDPLASGIEKFRVYSTTPQTGPNGIEIPELGVYHIKVTTGGSGKTKCLVINGTHCCEFEQNHITWGWIDWLAAGSSDALDVLDEFDFVFAVHTNPHGLYSGCWRQFPDYPTVDSNRQWLDTTKTYVQALKTRILADVGGTPDATVDIHGGLTWTIHYFFEDPLHQGEGTALTRWNNSIFTDTLTAMGETPYFGVLTRSGTYLQSPATAENALGWDVGAKFAITIDAGPVNASTLSQYQKFGEAMPRALLALKGEPEGFFD